MPEYFVQTSVKVKATRKVSYQCENCGGNYSYLFTIKQSSGIKDTTVSGSEKQKQSKEFSENLRKETVEALKKQIESYTKAEDYGHEKCPGCGYTQSWMINSLKGDQFTRKAFVPWIVISGLFIVGAILIFAYDEDVLLRCGVSFLIWLFLSFLIFLFGFIGMKNPNKSFGTVERNNAPIVVWSDPEVYN